MAKFPTYEEMAQSVAEKALDEIEYNGKTLRQWIEIISASEHGTNLAEVGTDLISRQAAIDALHTNLIYRMGTDSNKKRLDDWINSLPPIQPVNNSENPNSSDVISREQAIDAVRATLLAWSYMPEWRENKIIKAIERLQPVQPKRGKWIDKGVYMYVDYHRHLYECDQCGGGYLDTTDFCPHCGAKMEVNHESN